MSVLTVMHALAIVHVRMGVRVVKTMMVPVVGLILFQELRLGFRLRRKFHVPSLQDTVRDDVAKEDEGEDGSEDGGAQAAGGCRQLLGGGGRGGRRRECDGTSLWVFVSL